MRYEFTRAGLALAVCRTIAGCETAPYQDPSSGKPHIKYADVMPLMVRTDATMYEPGAMVRVRLDNRTGHTVRYNLCRSQLEAADSEGGQFAPGQAIFAIPQQT